MNSRKFLTLYILVIMIFLNCEEVKNPAQISNNNNDNNKNVKLIIPKGGEEWYLGNSYDIIWERKEVVDNYSVSFSSDSGKNWIPLILWEK